MTVASVRVPLKGVRLNEQRHRDTEIRLARLVTVLVLGEVRRQTFSGRLAQGPRDVFRPRGLSRSCGHVRTTL
ncbi:hypothetical protein PV350_36085 [Streptomyces sp. PA03-6a]|nr:hypothetical protein [Streptomyces sp. PA03-6a]